MYNEELKTKFIRSYTQSVNTASVATNIFNTMSLYEEGWQADLCTKTAEELQPVIDTVMALRSRSQWMAMSILKEYVKWCVRTKVPGACDGMLRITTVGVDKVLRQMVSSPIHLQRCLNEVFDKEQEETVDNIYRCYYWMAFSGIKEEDTLSIKASDICFPELRIKQGERDIPIYREALPAFHNAAELPSFLYKHPNYEKPIRRDRVQGDTLMRGVKAVTKTMTIRSILSKRSAEAIELGKTDVKLSFHRVWMSGLFYRMYEGECTGIPVNFSKTAIDATADKIYCINGINKRIKVEHLQHRKAQDYMEDYQRWKLAFSL